MKDTLSLLFKQRKHLKGNLKYLGYKKLPIKAVNKSFFMTHPTPQSWAYITTLFFNYQEPFYKKGNPFNSNT